MALHDFTMQQWWMESLTAKIIAFFIRITRILCFFFFFFFKRLSTERCRLHHHADRPSLKVAVNFHSRNCVQKNKSEHKRKKKTAELDQNVRIYQLFISVWGDIVYEAGRD